LHSINEFANVAGPILIGIGYRKSLQIPKGWSELVNTMMNRKSINHPVTV